MYSIKQKEEDLFVRWEEAFKKNGEESFCSNGGLLFRGEFGLNEINQYNEYTWYRLQGNEETLWSSSCKRLMILTKDLNDVDGWDIREESGGRRHLSEKVIPSDAELRYLGKNFYRRLNRWVYGIYNESAGVYPSFTDVADYKKMGMFYETAPLVRINCKVEIGGPRVENQVLADSINTYKDKDYLIEQINIYQANIILCCGYTAKEGNIILNFLKENIIRDLEEVNDTNGWIYYSQKKNVIAINAYHPTAWGFSDKWLYEELVGNFSNAVDTLKIRFSPL